MSALNQKPSFKFKQGDSFNFTINLKDADGLPLDIETTEIKSQVRKNDGTLVDTLVITNGLSTGEYTVSGQNTSNYPTGILYIDFKINLSGKIVSSQTLTIEIEKSITQW